LFKKSRHDFLVGGIFLFVIPIKKISDESKEILDSVERWAADEFRSTNGQLEWIISNALKREKRTRKTQECKINLNEK
jgi:hypothetical protein